MGESKSIPKAREMPLSMKHCTYKWSCCLDLRTDRTC